MKTICAGFILSMFLTTGYSQSDSFMALKEKFAYHHDVYSFSTSAFFSGAILKLAGEHEFYDAVKTIKRISVITIPKDAFTHEEVSLSGFEKVMRQDSFHELARMNDNGDHITFYIKSTASKNNRYMILVENSDDVVAIELTGYIDPEFLLNCESHSFKEKS